MISFLFRTFFVCLSAYLAKQNIFYSIFCSIFFSFYSLLFSLNLSLFFYFLLFFYFVILLIVQSFFCLNLFLPLSTLALGGEINEEQLIMFKIVVDMISKYLITEGLDLDFSIIGKVRKRSSL